MLFNIPHLGHLMAEVFGSLVKLIHGIIDYSSELENSMNPSRNAIKIPLLYIQICFNALRKAAVSCEKIKNIVLDQVSLVYKVIAAFNEASGTTQGELRKYTNLKN